MFIKIFMLIFMTIFYELNNDSSNTINLFSCYFKYIDIKDIKIIKYHETLAFESIKTSMKNNLEIFILFFYNFSRFFINNFSDK
jgi:hypothetical protein